MVIENVTDLALLSLITPWVTNDTWNTHRQGWQGSSVIESACLKPGFHTCVSRTHNGTRCLMMYGHQWSQSIPVFATKACELATKLHMLNFCEGLRGLCRDMLWLWPIETNNPKNNKNVLFSQKKAKPKTKKITTTFGKSLFLIKYRMRYTICMPLNTKDIAINQTMVAYGNRQNATAFARANNSDLLLKHLMRTRLKD